MTTFRPVFLQTTTRLPSTGEQTTGLLKQAGRGVRQTGSQTAQGLGRVTDFFVGIGDYLTSAQFAANVILTVVVALLGVAAYRLLTRGIPRILRWRRSEDDTWDEETIARVKREDTAITLIRNALRYVVFVVVVLFALSIFIRNPLPATAGATVLAAVLGFGAQSFLRDIIAGFSIVFEGQYAVGDFIAVEPQKVSGIVEELGLRMTKIRTLSSEIVFVPNGAVTGVTNYVLGQERYSIEVQLRGPEAAERVVNALREAPELYVIPPHLTRREEEDDGRVRLGIRAGVLPSMSWLVEENLTSRIKAAAGEEGLAAEPLTSKVDQASLRRVRNLLPADQKRFTSPKPRPPDD